MRYAPIVLFVYNRLEKTKKVLDSLFSNPEAKYSDLYIFSDGAKSDWTDVYSVREWIKSQKCDEKVHLFKLIERDCNWGLSKSVIEGVTEVIAKYGRIIVLEDDLELSSSFLKFMNEALEYYEQDERYGSVAAYTLPVKEVEKCADDVYATRKGDCWGWGTWSDRWESVDWNVSDYDEYLKDKKRRLEFESLQSGIDEMLAYQMSGKIDSWAVRWVYHLLFNKQITVYPKNSLVFNSGNDESGTHCKKTDIYDVNLYEGNISLKFVEVSKKIERANAHFGTNIGIRIRRRINILLGR